jgi:peptidoglycan/xylan/chitin deacetylase (PgdA/CDA1 family)
MAVDNFRAPLIFTVHKLRSGRWYDHTSLRPFQLRNIFRTLIDSCYQFVDVSNAVRSSNSDSVAITFDDGYAHLIDTLLPLCEEFGIRPTVFVPTAFIGRKNSWDYTSMIWPEWHLDKSQVRELALAGVEFGTHGHLHRPLTSLSTEELTDELRQSKGTLEDIVRREVAAISYPFGRVSDAVLEGVRDAGYSCGFGTNWPIAGPDNLHIGRISLYSFDTPLSVVSKIRGRLRAIERIKGEIAAYLSGGTGVLQRMRQSGTR